MATRRNVRRREAQIAFEALTIEGGLLSPEWLSRVAQLSAGHQAESDYRVPKGLNLRDELGRYWRMAQAHWNDFASANAQRADAKVSSQRFITGLLRDTFGFATLVNVEPAEHAGRWYPIGFAALSLRVPVVVAPSGFGLDTLASEFGDDNRKRSAFGLAQEFLNAADGAMWGLASDGLSLRVLRDNASLTRPAWLEVDLQRIFTEGRYADFAALWLLLHETRFGRVDQPVAECALEAWRTSGREEGTKAREKLRFGVEDALLALGQGFIEHRDNQALRDALQSGALTKNEYFQQLLRLVYRVIFLLTAEERCLLHAPDATEASKALYEEGYSVRRLRERAVRRNAFDHFFDLWEALATVVRGLADGQPLLGLPALAGIFSQSQCRWLDTAKLENHRLLTAIFRLSWIREDAALSRVNWRDMGPEELGSVYESLLELTPQVTDNGRRFTFAGADESKGNARKTSGSYYTPDSLVQVLLDSALEPVIQRTVSANPTSPVESLLQLSIVDPACGSGHFLLAAARRLAAHVARFEANGTPSANEYRHALRKVVGRCLFGVDLNPMAVELCKVALWMEAVEPGRPLSFLDSHIQQGNALLGTTPELMKEGVPDDAWAAIEGDEKKTAAALKKRNKVERNQASFVLVQIQPEVAELTTAVSSLDAASDLDVHAVASKATTWETVRESSAFKHQKLVADAWCSAFVWPKPELPSELATAAPTNEVWRQLRDEPLRVAKLTIETVDQLAEQFEFFHWHLAFPQVFANKAGFDVVLGNPPWEQIEMNEEAWFASRSPAISRAPNATVRKRLIEQLIVDDASLFREFSLANRQIDGTNALFRATNRFPLTAKGRINTYALFAEHNRAIRSRHGRAGFVVPTGLVTDDTTKEFFGALVANAELASFYSFENEEFVFPGVHHAFRFALITIGTGVDLADLVFFARSVPEIRDDNRRFVLSPEDFQTLNPNTRTCPTFRSRRDAALNLEIYRRSGVLWREYVAENGNPWGLRFMQGTSNMSADSGSFRTRAQLEAKGFKLVGNRFEGKSAEYLPLIEAKMVHHFDHRFGTYEGQTEAQDNQGKLPEFDDAAHADAHRFTHPYYWVNSNEVSERLDGVWQRQWLLGWRDICRSTDQRTIVASLLPRAAIGHTTPLMFPQQKPALVACLYANLCSFALDYAARQKVGGTHLTYGYLKQLPVLSPSFYESKAPWASVTVGEWLLPRVLELTYTAWDLEPFARDVGYLGPPFHWDQARRFELRCEIDAAFFRLYDIALDDAHYVLESFPVVKKNDVKAYDRYRTQERILEIYGSMIRAEQAGKSYETKAVAPVGAEGHAVVKSSDRAPSKAFTQLELISSVLHQAVERPSEVHEPAWAKKTPIDRQVLVLSRVVALHDKAGQVLGNVKAEKIVHLIEAHLEVPFDRAPKKEAAGPADFARLMKVGHRASMKRAFKRVPGSTGVGAIWSSDVGTAKANAQYEEVFGDRVADIDRLIAQLVQMKSDQAEIVATLHACWNELLANGGEASDEAIVLRFYEWSESKAAFERSRLVAALKWMREHDLVPTGRSVVSKPSSSDSKKKTPKAVAKVREKQK